MHMLGKLHTGERVPLSRDDKRRHLYIVGKTGTGKSSLLFNLMREDHGFALLDPHGDLAPAVAEAMESHRTNDVIYLDPSDLAHPFAFNPLSNVVRDMRPLIAAQVVASFKSIYGASWGPRLQYILTCSLRLLLDNPGSTLLGLPKLLANERYRAALLKRCEDPFIRMFWEEEFANYSDRLRSDAVAPVQNKVGALLSPPAIRNILGQATSTIDIPRLMNEGRVLILNLAKGKLGDEPAHLLGALFVSAFARAAEARSAMREDDRRDFTLYVDEFQNFATDSFATILSEARKWRLSLVLAHQLLGQLPDTLRQAVFGNVGTIICFRVGAEDAAHMADELDVANLTALTDTPNYHAVVKLSSGRIPSRALRVRMAEPITSTGRLKPIVERTRARHTRPIEQVERSIARFLANDT
jgi:type IV secretory pathway TraG/TraD family ATPase VirD4